ncbi:LysR family transcriptional regulator [Asticcacaulis sp. DW145]|uniref:LysR family transcriptional regulator n=1 Tax=Asticcacaulis sp. DW145 TaxID=3095608 RepID=UPI0030854F07|nr:LysR family transcriptional regulator [Asticcacaulis sp. DW145]
MSDPSTFNLRHLEAAAEVARLGAISRASAAVNLSQPTLTQGIAKLELQIGHRLFNRESGGCTPTSAGQLFIPRVNRALTRIEECCSHIRKVGRLSPISFPQRHISSTQLRAFLFVERFGSFSEAARQLSLSQPAIHRATRELELVLGVSLLVRVGQYLRPTASGERLGRDVRLALAELRAGLDDIASLSSVHSGRLTIGTLPLARAALLPQALSRFYAVAPGAEIVVLEGPYLEHLSALQGGEVDVIIGALRSTEALSDIRQVSLFEDDLYIVGRKGHPLDGQPVVDNALSSYPWVIGAPGAPMRLYWERLFQNTPRPTQTVQCSSVLTTRGLLLAGDWLALMSADQFRIEQAAGLLQALSGRLPGSRRDIGITMRRDWLPSSLQAAFLETLKEVATERRSGSADQSRLEGVI